MKIELIINILIITLCILAATLICIQVSDNKDWYSQKVKICEDNNYDFYNSRIPSEEGYVTCCNQIYENNIFKESKCVGVAK